MFESHGFQGYLTKLTLKGDVVPIVKVTIKTTVEGENQTFLNDLTDVFNIQSIKDLFEEPVNWDKITLGKDLNNAVSVEFDEIVFDGILTNISVSKKYKAGAIIYDYNFTVTKELSSDNLEKVIVTEYLNRKEEDEDGKKKLVPYHVKLTKHIAEELADEIL